DPADHDEVRIVDAQRRVAQQLGDDVQGEEADAVAVGCGLRELIGPDHAAGAGDVFDYNRGFAGNVCRQMLRDDAAFDVVGATGGVVDDHGDGAALVVLGGRGIGAGCGEDYGQAGRYKCFLNHRLLHHVVPAQAGTQ